MPRLYPVLVAALALLLLPAAASAANRYASPTGSGGACSQASPCSLTTAIEGPAAADGDKVLVNPGTYNQTTDLDAFDALEIQARNPRNRPVILVSSQNGLILDNDDASASDLTIVHSGGGAGLLLYGGTAARIESQTTEPFGTGCSVYKGMITDSLCWASAGGVGVGIYAGGDGSHNVGSGLLRNVDALSYQPGGKGIYILTASGVDFTLNIKNTIAGGALADIATETDSAPFSGAKVSARYSNYGSGAVTTTGTGTGVVDAGNNQSNIPLFLDPGVGDFRQFDGSPTIDRGTTSGGGVSATAYDGQPRKLNGSQSRCPRLTGPPDIGYDEYEADCTAPDTTILRHPARRTSKKKAKFTFKSSEMGSVFECKLDRQPWRNCDSGKRKYRGLASGKHKFKVRAGDALSNFDGTPAVYKWKIRG
jgi:hypothetical protein